MEMNGILEEYTYSYCTHTIDNTPTPHPPPPILPMHGIKFVEIFFKLSDLFILLISFQAMNLVLVIENFHPMVVINTLR